MQCQDQLRHYEDPSYNLSQKHVTAFDPMTKSDWFHECKISVYSKIVSCHFVFACHYA